MYTQCPDCELAFEVTADVLRQAAGKVRCGGCGAVFNSLESLTEERPHGPVHEPSSHEVPKLKPVDDGDDMPKSISAEQSAALMKTLDQLAGSDIRIEDTGVEWRVLDEDEMAARELDDNFAETGVELDELLDDAPMPVDQLVTEARAEVDSAELFDVDDEHAATVSGEMRFDDNTPLPFEFSEEDLVAAEAAVSPAEPDEIVVDPEDAEIELSELEEWSDLLGEIDESGDTPSNDGEPEPIDIDTDIDADTEVDDPEEPEADDGAADAEQADDQHGDFLSDDEAAETMATDEELDAISDEGQTELRLDGDTDEAIADEGLHAEADEATEDVHADSESEAALDDEEPGDEEQNAIADVDAHDDAEAAFEGADTGDGAEESATDVEPGDEAEEAIEDVVLADEIDVEDDEPGVEAVEVIDEVDPDEEIEAAVEEAEPGADVEDAIEAAFLDIDTDGSNDEPVLDIDPAEYADDEMPIDLSGIYEIDPGIEAAEAAEAMFTEESPDALALERELEAELMDDALAPETESSASDDRGQSDETQRADTYDIPPMTEEEQTLNLQIDQDLLALAIEDEDGFASTIVIAEKNAEEAARKDKERRLKLAREQDSKEPGNTGFDAADVDVDVEAHVYGMMDDETNTGIEAIVMEGEAVGTAFEEENFAADAVAAAQLARLTETQEADLDEQPRRKRIGLVAGVAFLLLLLAVQLMHQSREALATIPAFNNTVGQVYRAIGQPVQPSWDVTGWRFEVTNDSADTNANGDDVLTVHSRIGNTSSKPLPYPLISISLRDRFEETIGSSLVDPADYLPAGEDPRRHVEAGDSFHAVITINNLDAAATGYKLNVCYRADGVELRCNAQDFK